MKGNRTYLTVAVLVAAVVGHKAGWWTIDAQTLALIGGVAVAFLRAAIGRAQAQVGAATAPAAATGTLVMGVALAALLLTGCGSARYARTEKITHPDGSVEQASVTGGARTFLRRQSLGDLDMQSVTARGTNHIRLGRFTGGVDNEALARLLDSLDRTRDAALKLFAPIP